MRVLSKLSTLIVILTLFFVLAGCPDPENTPNVPTYTITISNIEHGTVTADKETAHAGETIVLSSTANHAHRLASYSVKTATGANVTVTNHEFQMPAENVTVDAVFWNKEGFVQVEGATVNASVSSNPPTGSPTSSLVFINNRTVTIPNMYVCDHEVTQDEYETYCNYAEPLVDDYNNPVSRSTYGEGTNYPAFNVTWYDAIVYCNLRSIAEKLTPVYKIGNETDPSKWTGIQSSNGKYCGPSSNNTTWNNVIFDQTANGYRLPTEAEWEFTARNRNQDPYDYAGSHNRDEVAWVQENSNNTVHIVKTTNTQNNPNNPKPNGLGIYDMSGNVWEWCWDWYGSINTTTSAIGATSGTNKVLRGGSWKYGDSNSMLHHRTCHCLYADPDDDYDRGFRVVRTVFPN